MASLKMKAKLLARSRNPAFVRDALALLEYLSPWFDIGMRKKLSSRLFNFQAVAKKA